MMTEEDNDIEYETKSEMIINQRGRSDGILDYIYGEFEDIDKIVYPKKKREEQKHPEIHFEFILEHYPCEGGHIELNLKWRCPDLDKEGGIWCGVIEKHDIPAVIGFLTMAKKTIDEGRFNDDC